MMRNYAFTIIKAYSILLMFFLGVTLFAQEYRPPTENVSSNRFFFGGGLGLQFGDVTLIDVSPMVGYRITEKLAAGVTLTYKYYNVKNYYANYLSLPSDDLKANIYGGSLFGRYFLFENLFAQAEYEYLLYAYDSYFPNSGGSGYSKSKETIDLPSFFLGGGYRQPIGGRTFFTITVLYNFSESPYSPYSNPIIRAGISVGM
jgi:hypothetical protein